jgi:hypothetical protein
MRLAWFVAFACSCDGHPVAGDGAGGDDAPSSTCDPLPPTAADPIHLVGNGEQLVQQSTATVDAPLIEVLVGTESTPRASTTGDALGAFTVAVPTGGVVSRMHLRTSKAGLTTTLTFLAAPLAADLNNIAAFVIAPAEYQAIIDNNAIAQSPGNGAIRLRVDDCDRNTVLGATVTTSPAGTVVYTSHGPIDTSATSTDADGIAYVFDLPPGAVTITAKSGATTYAGNVVTVTGDTMSFATVRP